MKIKSKIIAFQIFLVGVVILMGAVVYFAIGRADNYIERITHAYRQLETITALSLHANRYSEQIAEMLLFGEEGRQEFEEARRDLEESFAKLVEVTAREVEFLSQDERGAEELADERGELALIGRMREITARMHETALDLLTLKLSGRDTEARLRYFGEIEQNLDDQLQKLIDLAIADEREEVSRADNETAALTRELLAVVVATTLATIAASAIAVALLSRALSRPIGRLTEGAEAIGSGELTHRIPVEGRDELALLSGHFNRMAGQLETQRRELLHQQALLELKVGERTAQLEEANRRLKDLDRLRVLFLADVSHELRTPLTVLRGEAEVTLRGRSAQAVDYRETLERVVELAGQMSRLVDDLLFLTRAEADSIRFQIEPVDLCQVLEEAIEEGGVLAEGEVGLAARGLDGPVHVQGDRQRLKQAMLIGIDNAIKYSYHETTVEVTLTRDNGEAVARVRNRGPAIPPEDLAYVFDRFYRGQHGRATSGSGLGLSIAKWIVEKHGGSIRLASSPDGFTELEIRLRQAPAYPSEPVYPSEIV
jgi:two-component system OmpR family sensor kinase